MTITREAVARIVDHTLLKPEATAADVAALVAEANALGTYSICVSPSRLPVDAGDVLVATVCGFLETLAGAPRLPLYLMFPIVCAGMGLSQPFLFRRYR